MAKELDVPVIALSQLSRAVEARGDNKPMLVGPARVGRHRAGRRRGPVHLPRGDLQPRRTNRCATSPTVIIGKQRNGPTGQFDLMFNKDFTRFDNLQRQQQQQN